MGNLRDGEERKGVAEDYTRKLGRDAPQLMVLNWREYDLDNPSDLANLMKRYG